jgi:hypothetical protein
VARVAEPLEQLPVSAILTPTVPLPTTNPVGAPAGLRPNAGVKKAFVVAFRAGVFSGQKQCAAVSMTSR